MDGNAPRLRDAAVLSVAPVAADIVRLLLDVGDVPAEPGQFAHVSVPGMFLRRPVSIAGLLNGGLELFVQTVGEGTRRMAGVAAGTTLSMLAPLGRGFPMAEVQGLLREGRDVWLVGGGIGAAPLLFAADRILAAAGGGEFSGRVTSFVGFRDEAHTFGLERLSKCGESHVQVGGFVTDLLERTLADAPAPGLILACGPGPFTRALQGFCRAHGLRAYASLEEAMGCGLGACLTCSCRVRGEGGLVHHARVCKDGPVMDLAEVVLEEARS